MSYQVETWRIQQYKAGVEYLVQQRGSKLRSAVRVESQVGKSSFYDQIDATTVRKRTIRHGDSPYIPTPHARRQCVLEDYDWGDYVDDEDKLRTLNDPTNPYAMAGAMAMGRAIDQAIVDAYLGTAQTGETGATPLTFAGDGGTTIPDGGVGLTKEKLIDAKITLDNNEADVEGDEAVFVFTGNQLGDLLNENEVASSDYNSVKALVAGEVDTYMGFRFIRLSVDILPKVSTERSCFAFKKSGMLLGLGKDMEVRVAERPDKGFSTYLFNSMSIGATRMQGKKCVEVQCTES